MAAHPFSFKSYKTMALGLGVIGFLAMPLTAPISLAAPAPVTQPQPSSKDQLYKNMELFGEVFERVRHNHAEEVSDQKLIEAAINGMLQSLDAHSGYHDPQAFKDMRAQTKGEFGGLGLEVTMDNGLVKIVSPIDDTPAFKAGIQPGDLITHLDKQPVAGLTLNEAVEKMRGTPGTNITLTVRRGNQEPFDVALTRDTIKIRSVKSSIEDGIGLIRITTFNEQTNTMLQDAIAKIKEANPKVRGIVLDLRNNPGGLLDQAIDVTDMFLDRGEIVSTRGRDPKDIQRYDAKAGDLTDNLPIVVLINSGSASASEIVAGALQDHKRAVVLGTQSFGKGSVQTIIPLDNEGAIRLTTARYYTPSGKSIQAVGIKPDIIVEQAKIEPIADKGLHEGDLPKSLKQQTSPGTTTPTTPTPAPGSDNKTPAPTKDDKQSSTTTPGTSGATTGTGAEKKEVDYQLERAKDLIKGIIVFQAPPAQAQNTK